MNINSMSSAIQATTPALSQLTDKVNEKLSKKTDIPVNKGIEDMVDISRMGRRRRPSKAMKLVKLGLGAAIGAGAIALSGGGILATAAVGAAVWGGLGAVIGGVVGGIGGFAGGQAIGKPVAATVVGAGVGAVSGGGAGAFGGALKGALIGALSGVAGAIPMVGGPLAGAIAGGALSYLGI